VSAGELQAQISQADLTPLEMRLKLGGKVPVRE
jgi:hypothetical protein